jgi:hypothetical protein
MHASTLVAIREVPMLIATLTALGYLVKRRCSSAGQLKRAFWGTAWEESPETSSVPRLTSVCARIYDASLTRR